ncbi:MAG: dihydropteroate synthase [Methanotrichaceae archaeon]|nr:dihydropteroate synthase [Methanotrichaceae archaeon]
MIEGFLGRVLVGDRYPVRTIGVINLSQESFYKGSIAGPGEALEKARSFVEEGADLIDIGAVSTAPFSPKIDEVQERERLLPVLKQILNNVDIDISVDTYRSEIAESALSLGATCINDVSGLINPEMAKTIADYGSSVIVMASKENPGDLLFLDDIIRILSERVRYAIEAGISKDRITVDPGVGKWVPEKTPEYDLAILDGFSLLKCLKRPILAAVSRKSFIGAKLNKTDPSQRLFGSLAATAIAVYNGAHAVRTHDVAASLDIVRMAHAIRGHSCFIKEDGIEVEILNKCGHNQELLEHLRRADVDQKGMSILCRKGSFRILAINGISFQEAIIIKQEMLALGGDAAIPWFALQCDPQPEEIIVFGSVAQLFGLINKLKIQPFRLAKIGKAIVKALDLISEPRRYR